MIELNLSLIATAIGIIVSIWRFSNSISKFEHSLNDLLKEMSSSKSDRLSLRKKQQEHELAITEIRLQSNESRKDLLEIKEDLKEIKRTVK